MGLKAWLTSTSRPAQEFSGEGPAYTPVASMISHLEGLGLDATSRDAALRVTAVLKGRNMICNISTLPLVLLNADNKRMNSSLFSQFDPNVPNVVHLAMTVEDLLFDSIAWWEKTKVDANGWPINVRRVDSRRVSLQPPNNGYINKLPSGIDPESAIWVDGKPRSGKDFIRFDSPNPAFLVAGSRAIKRAVLLEEAAAMYADNPGLRDYFTPAAGKAAMSKEQVEATLRAWIASRKKRSTGFIPETLEYNTVQSPNPVELQLAQQMQKATLDLSNALGVDPEDLGVSTTSRTYQNATDRRQDRINDVLSGFMRAITDRLSMGDVTKRNQRAVFSLDDYMRADPKTRWEIHQIAHNIGATDIAEIRNEEDWEARDDLEPKEPEPAAQQDEEPVEDEVVPSANQMKGSLMKDTVPATFSTDAPSIDAAQTFRFESDEVTFAADTEKRTITGTAILYGVAADNGWGTFTFEKGSLEWNKSAVSRVKFLRDHDWKQLLGAATNIKDTGSGVTASFKVARGAAGDEALTLAEDGALDGLSVGIDIIEWTEDKDGNFTVNKAILNEVSLTPRPAFEDARLTKVTASKQDKNPEEEFTVVDEKTPDAPAPETVDLDEKIAAAVAAALSKAAADQAEADKAAAAAKAPEPVAEKTDEKPAVEASLSKTDKEEEKPAVVNPTHDAPHASFEVKEKSPYTFDGQGHFAKGDHEFSTDLVDMMKSQDFDGTRTEAGKRVMGHIEQGFVSSGDVNELNPPINQPGKYYEPRAQKTPLWDMINKGGLPNGLQPFTMPKFSSAGDLVNDHTEGVEPEHGTFVTTSQTITPSAVSGKVNITRETWDMGGNPATSTLIWNRMVREYNKGLESATATFLNGLAPSTIALPPGASEDAVIAAALQAALVSLTFADDYDFEAFALEQNLYERLANLVDANDRPLYPAVGAQNANGSVGNLFQSLNINGLRGVPAPALPRTPGAVNASYLFDPEVVVGYATGPQRLEFAGSVSVGSADEHPYAPVAGIDLAIWGYKAHAVIDLAGVRKVTYDSDAPVV